MEEISISENELRIIKDDIKLPDITEPIFYTSEGSVKQLQNKIAIINDNYQKIVEKIKEFIELLSKDSRTNDIFIGEKIQESLKNILSTVNCQKIDFQKLKIFVLKKIQEEIKLNDDEKTKLKLYIEQQIEPIVNNYHRVKNYEYIENINDKQKYVKKIYKTLLSNKFFIKKINEKINNAFNNRIKTNGKHITRDITITNNEVKKIKHNEINLKPLTIHLLAEYNKRALKTLEFYKKNREKTNKKNLIENNNHSNKLNFKLKKFFVKYAFPFNMKLFYKKIKKNINKEQKKYGNTLGLIKFSFFNIPFGLLKIGYKIGNVLFKTLKILFKIGKIILGVVFKMLTKIFSIVIKIGKYIFSLAKKILKPLKPLLLFLLTPQGMYLSGLIVGFLITKIKTAITNGFYKFVKKINKRHTELSGANLKLEKDFFGIPQISKQNLIIIKQKLEKPIIDKLYDYTKIIDDETKTYDDKKKSIKQQLEKDKNNLKKWFKKTFDFSNFTNSMADSLKKITSFMQKMMNNGNVREIELFMRTAGTGIMSHQINNQIFAEGVGTAIKTACIGIGAFFGPWGLIAGGLIGGILSALVEEDIKSRYQKIFFSKNEEDALHKLLLMASRNHYEYTKGKTSGIELHYRKNARIAELIRTGFTKEEAEKQYNKEIDEKLEEEENENPKHGIYKELSALKMFERLSQIKTLSKVDPYKKIPERDDLHIYSDEAILNYIFDGIPYKQTKESNRMYSQDITDEFTGFFVARSALFRRLIERAIYDYVNNIGPKSQIKQTIRDSLERYDTGYYVPYVRDSQSLDASNYEISWFRLGNLWNMWENGELTDEQEKQLILWSKVLHYNKKRSEGTTIGVSEPELSKVPLYTKWDDHAGTILRNPLKTYDELVEKFMFSLKSDSEDYKNANILKHYFYADFRSILSKPVDGNDEEKKTEQIKRMREFIASDKFKEFVKKLRKEITIPEIPLLSNDIPKLQKELNVWLDSRDDKIDVEIIDKKQREIQEDLKKELNGYIEICDDIKQMIEYEKNEKIVVISSDEDTNPNNASD